MRLNSKPFFCQEKDHATSHPVSLPVPRRCAAIPLSDDQLPRGPSIFADALHESRSERYSYIPTAAVLTELRKEEAFSPSW